MRINRAPFLAAVTLLFTLHPAPSTASVSVQPATVAGGTLVTSTVTFTVPTSGLAAGSAIAVDLPANWNSYLQTNCPSCGGYVVLSTTAPLTFSALNVSTSGVTTTFLNGAAVAGTDRKSVV